MSKPYRPKDAGHNWDYLVQAHGQPPYHLKRGFHWLDHLGLAERKRKCRDCGGDIYEYFCPWCDLTTPVDGNSHKDNCPVTRTRTTKYVTPEQLALMRVRAWAEKTSHGEAAAEILGILGDA